MIPNGPGLLAGFQQDIFSKLTSTKKLFSAVGEKLIPATEQVAKKEMAERKSKPKAKPTVSDMLKYSGVSATGFILLHNALKSKGKQDGTGEEHLPKKGLLSQFLGQLLGGAGLTGAIGTTLGPALAPKLIAGLVKNKALLGKIATISGGILGIAVGTAMIALDAFKGTKKAQEWGVSKLNAGISAGLAGTSSGWKGAATGALKWGSLAGGIGLLVGGPIGGAIGGLLGAGVGAVLGAIGGKELSKGFSALGKWARKTGSDVVSGVVSFSKKLVSTTAWLADKGILGPLFFGISKLVKDDKVKELWKSDKPFAKKLFGTIGRAGEMALDAVASGVGWIASKLGFDGAAAAQGVKDAAAWVDNMLTGVTDFVTGWLHKGFDAVFGEGSWSGLVEAFTAWKTKAGEAIRNFFKIPTPEEMEVHAPAVKQSLDDFNKAAPDPFKREGSFLGGAPTTNHNDAVFSLKGSLAAGKLFGQAPNQKFNTKDELYVMASTNPSRDALAMRMDQLTAIIATLAKSIEEYKPQTTMLTNTIQSSRIPLQELLAKGVM